MNKLIIQTTIKCGAIYRSGPQKFAYHCDYCNQVLMDTNIIFNHIEAHFSSTIEQTTIPIPTEQIFLNEQIQDQEKTSNVSIKLETNVKSVPEQTESEKKSVNKIDNGQIKLKPYEYYLFREPTTIIVHGEPVPESQIEDVQIEPKNNKSKDLNINNMTITKRRPFKGYRLPKFEKFHCDICGIVVSSRPNMKDHMEIHINIDKYQCSICDEKFFTRLRLRNHKANHQSIPCPFCGKVFLKLSLQSHVRTHTGEKITCKRNVTTIACHICGKMYPKTTLPIHIRIHTGEKPFKCDVCGKCFVQPGALKGHMLVHTGETKHKCNQCDAAFKRKEELRSHMWRRHDEESPHKCQVCGKVFMDYSSLRDHKRVHTGERPFSCDVCGLFFAKKSTLRNHRLIHTGKRNYKCKYCERSFVQNSTKNSHEKRMHKIQTNSQGTT